MRFSEILNLVRLNLIQNKFKVLTSIGIIVGAATIVIVIAVGRGGKAEVAEQFRNLNAGAIDISYEQAQGASGRSSRGGHARRTVLRRQRYASGYGQLRRRDAGLFRRLRQQTGRIVRQQKRRRIFLRLRKYVRRDLRRQQRYK